MRRFRHPAVALALLALGVPGLPGARAQGVSPGPRHLYIMFIPGLCGWPLADRTCQGHIDAAVRATATFATLRGAMRQAHMHYASLFFGYNRAHPSWYTVGDTHQSLGRSTDALERQLRAVATQDPTAIFDLAGYSLGGVIAASWAAGVGRSYGLVPSNGLLPRVQSIVTFDSPVKGLHSLLTGNIVAQVFGGAVWYSLQPDSEAIREITFFPDSWWRSVGRLHSVANRADLIVPPSDALLGDKRQVTDRSCSRDVLILRSCHGAVMNDAPLARWVACHWIDGPDFCLEKPSPTPTPSPTLTPSPTATASPTVLPTQSP